MENELADEKGWDLGVVSTHPRDWPIVGLHCVFRDRLSWLRGDYLDRRTLWNAVMTLVLSLSCDGSSYLPCRDVICGFPCPVLPHKHMAWPFKLHTTFLLLLPWEFSICTQWTMLTLCSLFKINATPNCPQCLGQINNANCLTSEQKNLSPQAQLSLTQAVAVRIYHPSSLISHW